MNKLLIFPFVLLLFSACHDSRRYPAELVQADSAYMRGDYPLADSLLAAYDWMMSHEEADYMYAKLLKLSRKFVRASISEHDFMTADSVMLYYQNHRNDEKLGKAMLFMGQAYHAAYDYPSAIDCYLKADELAKGTGNTTLHGWITKTIGSVYFDQRMLSECIPYYREYYNIFKSRNDTLRMAHASYRMAIVYTIMNDVDSVIFYYQQMIELGKHTHQADRIVSVAKCKLSDIYIQIEEYDEAKKLMNYDSLNFVNWAYWHYGQHHTDSAIHYFRKALPTETLRGKADILRMLAMIEKKCNNNAGALQYLTNYLPVADSLQQQTRIEESQRIQAQYNYNRIKNEHDQIARDNERLRSIILFILFISLFLILLLYSIYINLRNKKEEELLQERRLRQLEADNLRQSKEQIERNNAEIASLKNQLDEARRMNDIEFIHRLELETEKLEAENKNIEILQKHRELKEKQLFAAPLCQHVMKHAGQDDFHLTGDQWQELAMLIDDAYDHFTDRLLGLSRLSENELRVCYLIKLGVASAHIATMMFKSKSAVTMMRQRMCRKILKKEGTATQLNEFICSL